MKYKILEISSDGTIQEIATNRFENNIWIEFQDCHNNFESAKQEIYNFKNQLTNRDLIIVPFFKIRYTGNSNWENEIQ